MNKKKSKDKKSRPLPKPNRQIPNSMIRQFSSIGQNPVMERAREFPFHGCWIMDSWEEAGITPVVVARQQEADKIMFGVYMVDYYCLGIKNAYTRADYSLNRFQRELPDICHGHPEPCSVEFAHELIHGALEYAEKLGLEPHPDFKKQMADIMLDPPDAHPRVEHIEFGKDGKPFFIPGPYDDKFKINTVINTLRRTCGEGNFNVLFIG